MRSRSGIESRLHFAFVEEPCPAPFGAPVHSLAASAPGVPEPTDYNLQPPGGGRGNSRQGRRWCRVARADRDSQVSALGVGLRSGAPFPVHAPDSTPETWTSQQEPCVAHCPSSCRWLWWLCGFGGFVFTHGHFGFQKQRTAPVCMILMIFLEARPRAGAIKATPATDLMVFPAVPDHSRPQVRLALSCRPRLGFGSRGLVVRSLRHLPWGSHRQAMKFRRSAAGKSRCRTPLPSRGPELSPEWQAF